MRPGCDRRGAGGRAERGSPREHERRRVRRGPARFKAGGGVSGPRTRPRLTPPTHEHTERAASERGAGAAAPQETCSAQALGALPEAAGPQDQPGPGRFPCSRQFPKKSGWVALLWEGV